jgi:hypothetical protein
VKPFVICVLAALVAAPAMGQFQQFQPFRNDQYSPRNAEGMFDIVAYVDGEGFIYIKGTTMTYLQVAGAPLRDAGSNYSQGIPEAVYGSFNMVKIAGRGEVSLHEGPSPANKYTAIVRVNDRNPGSDLYHIRLDWTWNPANPKVAPGGRVASRPLDSQTNVARDYNRSRNGSFEFEGNVDDVTVLYIRSDQVRVADLAGRPIRGDSFRFSQPLPAERLKSIEIAEVSGRGVVELVEKPWEGNKFEAVVLISDPQRSSSYYRFTLSWSR